MSQKSQSSKFSSILKWIVAAICCLFGLKLAIAVFTFISTGLALATVALWGAGALAVGGGIAFVAYKMLASKKR